MKTILYILAVCLLVTSNSFGTEQGPIPQTAINAGQALANKFDALGSFRANYEAVAPDKSAEITIIFNKNRKYCLVKVAMAGTDSEDFYTVSDFSRVNEKDGGVQLLIINGNKEKRFSLSFKELLEHLDSPFGIFFFMAKQCSEINKDFDEISLSSSVPSLSLGLSDHDLTLGIGICAGSNSLAVSWLNCDTITNATNVIESQSTVEFTYKYNHTVSIDRETGLLRKDCYPNPARPGRREIVLKAHSALEQDLPYASLIPSFESLNIENMLSKQWYEQLSLAWLTELGRKLSSEEKIDEILRIHSAAITAAARKAGRQMMREEAKAIAQKFATKEKATLILETFLIPAYEKYKKDHLKKSPNLSFNEFLDLLATADTNTTTVLSADSGAFINQLVEIQKKRCEFEIVRLPKDAQEGLKKINAISMPALAEGFVEECSSKLCSAMLDQAKTVYADNLTKDKNVPSVAPAPQVQR